MALFRSNVSGGIPAGVRTLPTVSTASGSIATFDTDMTENLVEVKCQIVATQGGSGTPSPSNPRPITTYSETNVIRVGKNLVIGKLENYTIGSSGNITGESGRAMNFAPVKQGETYTITTDDISNFVGGYFTEIPKSGSISYNGQRIISNNKTVTAPIDGYIAFRSTDTYATAQCEKGSFATAFEPQGLYANIPFGQTVANGVLDVTTGKLKVTHEIEDLGNLTWTKGGNNHFADLPETIKRTSSAGETANIVCEIFATAPQTSYTQNNNQITYYYTGSTEALSRIIVYSTDYADLTSFETAITGYKMMWELATPIEIQLDSITLQALLNENNIWCDTGDTEVNFLLSVGKKVS